jgi:hypothetical protein
MSDVGSKSTPEVAVVIPLEDPRGDVVEHLRTWTRDQTLSRDRFQVVLGADGRHPEFERRVADELAPQDSVVSVPSAAAMGVYDAEMVLYDAAARTARAPVIVFTEAHCRAEPECLAAVAGLFATDAAIDAATFHHRQGTSNTVSRLSELWFKKVHTLWDREDWDRLSPGGSAIRFEAYTRAGGLDPDLELFAPSFMSARLHQQGGRVEHLEEAAITHVLEDDVGEDLKHSRSHARGECMARAKHDDPEFFERYFGPAGLWDRRSAYERDVTRPLLAALISASRRSPHEARWLGRELAALLPSRVARERPRWAWENAMAGLHGTVANSGLFPFETRWRSYIASTERSVDAVRLRMGARESGLPEPTAVEGPLSAEELDGVLVRGHGLEREEGGRAFRWTEPVALFRLWPPPDGGVLRLGTAGLRGRPLDYLQGIYAGSSQLQPEMIGGDDEVIEAAIPADFARTAAETGIAVICRPLIPSRDGSSDRRRLGMPVVEIELNQA